MKHIFILLYLISCISCINEKEEDPKIINYINVNDKLPAFTVQNAAGEKLETQDLTGNVTLLVFFVTTCPDCKRELPKIESVWKALKEVPYFRLVAISRQQTPDTVAAYWKEQQFTMPYYLDPDRKIYSLFANNTIPRLYIIDRENTVTWMAVKDMELTAQQLIEKLINL